MDINQVYEKLNKFIEAIIPEYNPEKIVLYGSYAKGSVKSYFNIAKYLLQNGAALNI